MTAEAKRALRDALGLKAEIGNLYAVIPLDCVANAAERSMLVCHCKEHRHGIFGIYHGDEAIGVVQSVYAPYRER